MDKILKVVSIVFLLLIMVACSHTNNLVNTTKVKSPFLIDSKKFLLQYGQTIAKQYENNDKATFHFVNSMNYTQNNNYNLAMKEVKESLEISLKTVGKFNSKTAFFYKVLADISTKQKDYVSAIEYLEELLLIFKNQKVNEVGVRRRIVAEYNNLAISFADKKEYDRAIRQCTKSLEYLSSNDKKIIRIYEYISYLYNQQKRYKEKIEYEQKVIDFIYNNFGKSDERLVEKYFNIAQTYSTNKQYKESINYIDKGLNALAYSKESNSSKKIIQVVLQSLLSKNLIEQKKYKQALNILIKTLKSIKTIKTPNLVGINKKMIISGIYFSIGQVYHYGSKEYKKALPYYEKAKANLNIKAEKKFYTELIDLYKKLISKNIELYRNNVSSDKTMNMTFPQNLPLKNNEKNNQEIEELIFGLGLIELSLNYKENYDKQLNGYIEILKEYKNKLDKDSQILAYLYIQISSFYKYKGESQKYLLYLNKALNTINLASNKSYPLLVTIYQAKGELYPKKITLIESYNFYKKAYMLSKKYITYKKEKLNQGKIFDKNEYNTKYYYFQEQHKEAYYYSQKLFNSLKKSINNKSWASNKIMSLAIEKAAIGKKQKDNTSSFLNDISIILSVANAYKNSLSISKEKKIKIIQTIFNQWLEYKGTIYTTENNFYLKSKNPIIIQKIKKLKNLNKTLNHLYIKGSKKEIDTIEKEISKIKDFLFHKKNLNTIHYNLISKNLSPNQLYIDIVSGSQNYYIFTLDSDNNITFEKISKHDTYVLNKATKNFRKDTQQLTEAMQKKRLSSLLKNKLNTSTKKILFDLYQTLIEGYIYKQIKNKKSLLISTDGLLNFLPFEALYHNGKYLIEDYDISYISSGREFVRQTKRQKANPKYEMICFGNPDFNSSLPIAETKFMSDKQVTLDTWEQYKHFSPIGDDEIKTIRKYYPNALIYEKKNATTSNLMKVESSKILHFSTHGKFLTNSTIKNPMLKAGLALAGANKPNSDGIVTALKLSALDLKDTELVVLSACESGLGDIQNSEGVMGLPKAFLQAGAREVIMSLWSVSTLGTAELMEHFYENVHSGQSYATALRNAKIKMIEEKQHPYYWSAFILHGVNE